MYERSLISKLYRSVSSAWPDLESRGSRGSGSSATHFPGTLLANFDELSSKPNPVVTLSTPARAAGIECRGCKESDVKNALAMGDALMQWWRLSWEDASALVAQYLLTSGTQVGPPFSLRPDRLETRRQHSLKHPWYWAKKRRRVPLDSRRMYKIGTSTILDICA